MRLAILTTTAFAAVIAAAPAAAAGHKVAAKPSAEVDADAAQAIDRMSAYLGTLKAFEIKAEASQDVVMEDGEKVQVVGQTSYRVRRPNGFVIETATAGKVRRFYYDGKQFTIYAPELGYYAKAPAPATIRETMAAVDDKFGVELPLQDLFKWGEPNHGGLRAPTSGWRVGDATIDGVATDQYAFRTGDYDWQIWIAKGAQPVPKRLVIIDRTDEARPAYSAKLSWNVNATLADADFTFIPDKDAKQIHLASREK
jgi:hypothetical protein